MLSDAHIAGMPVIGLDDGSEIGTVRQAIIDSAQGRVVALAIDNHRWWRACRIALFEDIVSAGREVLVVRGPSQLFAAEERPELEGLVAAERCLLGRKVYTKGGSFADEIRGFSFEEADGRLAHLEVQSPAGDECHSLDYQRVLVLGRDVVVVKDDNDAGTVASADADSAAQNGQPFIPVRTADAEPVRTAAPPLADEAAPPAEEPERDHSYLAAAVAGEFTPPLPADEVLVPESLAGTTAGFASLVDLRQSVSPGAGGPKAAAPPVFFRQPPAATATSRAQLIQLSGATAAATALAPQLSEEPEAAEADYAIEALPASQATASPPPVAAGAPREDATQTSTTTGADLARLFRERQERFLLGKTAQRSVRDDAGNVVAAAGGVVDQALLDTVKQVGKLLELTASVSLRR